MIGALFLAVGLLGDQRPEVFRLDARGVTGNGDARGARRVASLQKPWVALAWALSHDDGQPPPEVRCQGHGACWLPGGHGRVSLSRAVAVSCNAYFRALAGQVPPAILEGVFREAGFRTSGPLTADEAIGLGGSAPRIAPADLLEAYARLARNPWAARDDVRLAVLDGMRAATAAGTASSIPMPGLLGKTGTSPSPGPPGSTAGWAVLLDPSGDRAFLLHLPRGTGALAARRLAESLREGRDPLFDSASPRSPRAGADLVRVRLFSALAPGPDGQGVVARNLGTTPASRTSTSRHDFLGPGAEHALVPGDSLGPSLWELRLASHGLVRVVRGALELRGTALVLSTSERDYVEGVVRAELRDARSPRAVELASAVLRFLSKGPRHGAEDVCDLTHCAWFTGLGPDVTWDSPARARVSSRPSEGPTLLSDADWAEAALRARQDGPSSWSAHCGGEPLAAHEVWGRRSGFDAEGAPACPRHPSPTSAWRRDLPARDVEAALGKAVTSLAVVRRDGTLLVRAGYRDGSRRDLLWDEIHRLLAPRLGWNALPSPPDAIERTATGFIARGHGSGHRVGLCLAD